MKQANCRKFNEEKILNKNIKVYPQMSKTFFNI